MVEHVHGKDGVPGSNPGLGSSDAGHMPHFYGKKFIGRLAPCLTYSSGLRGSIPDNGSRISKVAIPQPIPRKIDELFGFARVVASGLVINNFKF